MAADDVSSGINDAKDYLREEWQESGATDAVSCPDCDAAEFEWEVRDEAVRIRCEQCGYVDSRRYD